MTRDMTGIIKTAMHGDGRIHNRWPLNNHDQWVTATETESAGVPEGRKGATLHHRPGYLPTLPTRLIRLQLIIPAVEFMLP